MGFAGFSLGSCSSEKESLIDRDLDLGDLDLDRDRDRDRDLDRESEKLDIMRYDFYLRFYYFYLRFSDFRIIFFVYRKLNLKNWKILNSTIYKNKIMQKNLIIP